MTEKRKMIPTYLSLKEYAMVKRMAEDDMRSMSSFMKVLIHNEGNDRNLTPDMFEEEASQLKPGKW
jgi:hypothetical protein